jgi:hypothetical protein
MIKKKKMDSGIPDVLNQTWKGNTANIRQLR